MPNKQTRKVVTRKKVEEEINEMVTGRATQKVSEMKNYFFEKMNNMNTFSNK